MSDKYYTAEQFDSNGVLIHMPSNESYVLTRDAARKLRDSLDAVLAPAFTLTDVGLQKIMPRLPMSDIHRYMPFLDKAMADHQINTPLRAAAFLAQLAHESGELKWFEEIWGPTKAQRGYEGRADLGNTQPGDGYKYRGRGPIQLTGRSNFKKYGALLGVDFVNNPDLAATPEWGFQTAALYWKLNHCNEYADQENFKAVTRAINGGLTNLADRERYYEAAKKALA